jgi:trk system potassium uptake protein TrkA
LVDHKSEPVVVIGLGRFGSALALELAYRGTEVLAIDNDAKLVQSLSGQLTHIVTADSTDIEALRQLGVHEFYRAVVAIGTDMESSILTTSLLVDLEIDNIWAKAISRQHGRILERIGAHHVVFPEHDMGIRVAHLVSGRVQDYLEVDEDFAIVKTQPPKEAVGIRLGETGLRSKYGVTVVSVKTQGEPFTYATADTVLMYGDTIIVAGKVDDVERFVESG